MLPYQPKLLTIMVSGARGRAGAGGWGWGGGLGWAGTTDAEIAAQLYISRNTVDLRKPDASRWPWRRSCSAGDTGTTWRKPSGRRWMWPPAAAT